MLVGSRGVEGPSPRIRGECTQHRGDGAGRGTIPANTGRMLRVSLLACLIWDHPREYGENALRSTMRRESSGPSPRIRGECLSRASIRWGPRDHPREYGENASIFITQLGIQGPSPRIRGEFRGRCYSRHCPRTIPANTGRIAQAKPGGRRCWDHPREYGENKQICLVYREKSGPSPRIRGELMPATEVVIAKGTIPANTGRITAIQRRCTAHHGPSPRIRGELMPATEVVIAKGTIPANTGRITAIQRRCTAHHGPSPRIRGECV